MILSVMALTISTVQPTLASGALSFKLTLKTNSATLKKSPVRSAASDSPRSQPDTPDVALNPKTSTVAPIVRSALIAFPTGIKDDSAPSSDSPTPQTVDNDAVSVAQSNDSFGVAPSDDRLVAMAPDDLFNGGSDSLVAKAVGSAEGTRTPDGGKTWAYYGHTDPGNRAWNMGSFSYQHGAQSPEDADVKQLTRLRQQFEMIRQSAASNGLRLGLAEQLNGIDLANQAPLAALDRGGYVDRLRQAYAQGLRGSDAVLHARTYSYINPNTNQWDAPGLGNTYDSINRDQARRLNAVAEAIANHQSTPQRNSKPINAARNNSTVSSRP